MFSFGDLSSRENEKENLSSFVDSCCLKIAKISSLPGGEAHLQGGNT